MSSSTTRPVRTVRPSNRLNKDNAGELELASHRKFIETAQAPAPSSKSPSPETRTPSSSINSAVNDAVWVPHSESGPSIPGKRRPRVSESSTSSSNVSSGDIESLTATTSSQPNLKAKRPKKKKKKKTSHGMFLTSTLFSVVLTVMSRYRNRHEWNAC
jgi:hypothetical protein